MVLCKPRTGRMHQIRVHLQFLGYPVVNDPLYNHTVFGPEKGKGGRIGKSDDKLIADLISIHNAENWLGLDEDGLGPVQPGSIIGQNIQLREPEGETSNILCHSNRLSFYAMALELQNVTLTCTESRP